MRESLNIAALYGARDPNTTNSRRGYKQDMIIENPKEYAGFTRPEGQSAICPYRSRAPRAWS